MYGIYTQKHCIIIHTSLFLSECLYFVFTNQDILDTIQSYHKVITNMIVKEKKNKLTAKLFQSNNYW